MKTSYN